MAQGEGTEVRDAGFLLAKNYFQSVCDQNLLSQAPGPGTGWVCVPAGWPPQSIPVALDMAQGKSDASQGGVTWNHTG